MTIQEYYDLEYKEQQIIFREYWVQKLGYFPTKIEKVAIKQTREEARRLDELADIEFEKFLKKLK